MSSTMAYCTLRQRFATFGYMFDCISSVAQALYIRQYNSIINASMGPPSSFAWHVQASRSESMSNDQSWSSNNNLTPESHNSVSTPLRRLQISGTAPLVAQSKHQHDTHATRWGPLLADTQVLGTKNTIKSAHKRASDSSKSTHNGLRRHRDIHLRAYHESWWFRTLVQDFVISIAIIAGSCMG